MKKTLLVLSLIILAVFGAEAQKARIGIKGGVNFANLKTDLVDEGKTGFHAGLYAEFGAGGISIMPELLFSTKGAKDIDLTYIEVPILLKKSFAKVLNIHLGPQFGLLTKAEFGGIDGKDLFEDLDVSAVLGLGLDLPGGLSAGGRYIHGFSEIDGLKGGVTIVNGTNTRIKNNKTFQIYIGYKLFGK